MVCRAIGPRSPLTRSRAWIEASTKGAVLLFTAAEIETLAVNAGISPGSAGLLGGMGGGVAQASATMYVHDGDAAARR